MQTLFISLLTAVILLSAPAAGAEPADAEDSRRLIHALLDDFHRAAAEADRDRYLGHFAPDGVFMGTDDWERWPLPAFTDYVEQRFASGTGWRYVPEQRVIGLAADANTAWFDELVVSPRWGRFRGTGVLLRRDGEWKIAHYSLTALIPNERFEEVAKIAGEGFAARQQQQKP
jgi:hypothetical protein